jgi:hypothetical protein
LICRERRMTSRERITAAWEGKSHDHAPMTTWCFGFQPPEDLKWKTGGKKVNFWYTTRIERTSVLSEPWSVEDDFKRILAWRSLGIDDVLEVSVPWGIDPEVKWVDSAENRLNGSVPAMTREYSTPSGRLRHTVKKTDEEPGDGWVRQPDHVPLFDDFNIPRGIEHAVSSPDDIQRVGHLYRAPDEKARQDFDKRMKIVGAFGREHGVPVQAWVAFGMDGVIWLTGVEGAVLMAMDAPSTFGKLVDTIAEGDYGRAELACSDSGIDMICQRGWYSSLDFWSPKLFDEFVCPHLKEIAGLAHKHGKNFGYVMTTGVEALGTRLMESGVDVLYFIDPVQDTISVERARELLGGGMTLVGGTNSVSLASKDTRRIIEEVRRAMDVLGPTGRFILHPVDAIFPDTPWESLKVMIDTWKEYI